MWLRAGLPLLWRGATQVQVGTDPRWAVVLADLSPSAARAVRSVGAGADAGTLLAALADEAVDPQESQAVLDHLRTARLLVDVAPSTDSPEAAAWSLLSEDGDGGRVMARRRAAVVRVVGLGRCGTGIATTIASAGVGTVEMVDPGTVTRHDVGAGGYTVGQVGTPRSEAAARAVHDVAPLTRIRAARGRTVDLVVLVEARVADPVRHRRLLQDGVAHLSVVLREASGTVGPLVVPGRTACLRCADLHRTDGDPGWPSVAAQLAVDRTAALEDATQASSVAAFAAAQVMAHVDGRPTGARGAAWEIAQPDLVPRPAPVPFHPECGCTGLPTGTDDHPSP